MGMILSETFLQILFSVIIYSLNYSIFTIFTYSEITGESILTKLVSSSLFIFTLRFIFCEVVTKYVINYFVKKYLLIFNLLSISIFMVLVFYYYGDTPQPTDVMDYIKGWYIQLFLSVFIVGLIFAKSNMNRQKKENDG